MKRYSETLIFILVMVIVGGGIQYLQTGYVIGGDLTAMATGEEDINAYITQLEQMARITHDYINGYLSGPRWGTALPDDQMIEEMEQLYLRFQVVQDAVKQFDPEYQNVDLLLERFVLGFTSIETGLLEDDQELLHSAHQIFHELDYQVFGHSWGEDINI